MTPERSHRFLHSDRARQDDHPASTMTPRTWLRELYFLRRCINSEETYLRKCLRKNASPGQTLLDVGCGFCRFQPIVASCGLKYIGIDINPDTIEANRSRDIHCFQSEEFMRKGIGIDVLLLSHIIEHFAYRELVNLLNTYLPSLRTGGLLIIFTPLGHRGFYDDFDHVKPYNPSAIRQTLCQQFAQTQAFGIMGRFEEIGIWFKRDSLWHSYRERQWMHILKIPLALLTILSWCRIGRLTGYGMILKKTGE